MGDVVSIVGPTGSGKTTLINDIELFANADTPTGRRVLINGERAPAAYRDDPARNPIALITQHTTFLSDLPVDVFLQTHARIRKAGGGRVDDLVAATLDFANQLTGEPVAPGLLVSTPESCLVAVSRFRPWSARGRHTMLSEGIREPI
ncbi:ATP-binding cassette domain-containing protein [Rhodospirillum rubrum]|nr:ATP-binding cassette domain-containing protein [Rhodospirillum rubrum]